MRFTHLILQRTALTSGVLLPTDRFRFVQSPTSEVRERLSAESEELKSDKSNLGKKLNYLETTYKNSQDHLERLFKSGSGG